MVRDVKGEAYGRDRDFLEASRSLDPIWIQALKTGKLTVQFRPDQEVAETDLFFLADTFGYELTEKRIAESEWIKYYFR